MDYSIVSFLIPVAVIIIASFTKRIIPSLIFGLFIGGVFLAKGNVIDGSVLSAEHLVKSIANEDNLYIVLFLFLFGAFGEIIKVSGGIKGFTKLSERFVKTERGALGAVWLVSAVTFIDCCFHAISAGTIGKALVEKVNGNRYRLAFVVNVTSCLLIILIPFCTTYVGYIVGVIGASLSSAGVGASAYGTYINSIPFNFYAIIMVLISIGVTVFHFGFKKINTAVGDAQLKASEHGSNEAHEQCEFEEKAPPRPLNLIVPLVLLIGLTFFFFWYTGKDKGTDFISAFMNADFEKSIFLSSIITLALTAVFYLFQKIPMKEIETHFLSGGGEMIPPIIILLLSWGLSSVVQDLGFSGFIANVVGTAIPDFLIPVTIFLIGCAASYFMGSAWGTWALIMPIAVTLAVSANVNMPLVISAVLAGGALGDNASPLGETAVLTSTISDIPLMEHVKTELPYCFTAIGISAGLFILFAL